ncbi:MAG: TetR/AcrR family transcriptional regulator [Desulfovibrio sp.]|nr:TetR/AcrR family transcriptional regulator [Desulfovibrio sp.]
MNRNPSKKAALLQAAKELFGEYGYAETTFKKISDRAGVALGLLTHHYGNKEKLFLASGLDVLEQFLAHLKKAVAGAPTGYDAVMRFCRAYLDFSIDPHSNWLVLVRCSPYSDMKTKTDRDLMDSRFARIHELLAGLLVRGVEDGSLVQLDADGTAQVVISLLVGANRTRVLTPYAPQGLYEETLAFVSRSIKSRGCGETAGGDPLN